MSSSWISPQLPNSATVAMGSGEIGETGSVEVRLRVRYFFPEDLEGLGEVFRFLLVGERKISRKPSWDESGLNEFCPSLSEASAALGDSRLNWTEASADESTFSLPAALRSSCDEWDTSKGGEGFEGRGESDNIGKDNGAWAKVKVRREVSANSEIASYIGRSCERLSEREKTNQEIYFDKRRQFLLSFDKYGSVNKYRIRRMSPKLRKTEKKKVPLVWSHVDIVSSRRQTQIENHDRK